MTRRIVVTGLGVVTPLSQNVDDLWKRILNCESGIHRLQVVDVDLFKIKIGGDIYDWDPSEIIPSREAKRMDRFTQFAMVAGTHAINDSGINFEKEDPFRCGAILGSGIGGIREIETQVATLLSRGPERVSPMTIPRLMLNAAGGNLAIHYGMRGPNYGVATACASANNAMGDALRMIQCNDADIVVSGGTESAITPMGLSAFQNMKALSRRNDEPERASRPFDKNRDGFVMGEGAGVLVFEELEHAKARGAKIYCEVIGFGASCDAGHITQPDPEGLGACRSMSNALDDANINADQVDYLNAHGTSTPLGDLAETKAIKNVFGDHAYKLSVSSTKSALGHSLGASGGIELILSIMGVQDQVAPPTINLETPDPECDLDYTPLTPKQRPIEIAMSNSFGFGGHNASIVIQAFR